MTEWMTASTVIQTDPANIFEGSLMWVTESADQLRLPLIVLHIDIIAPFGRRR